MRVLLVEHSDGDTSALGAMPGIEVERVPSLSDAAKLLAHYGRFDVVLLDLALPDATGLEALTRLHGISPYTPIVVVSGPGEGLEAVRAGAQDSFEKGADVVRVLRYAFERAVAARRQRDDVLAMLAHKLRTPLTAILRWTHLLRNGKVVEAKQPKAYDTIERIAQSQATLIEDISHDGTSRGHRLGHRDDRDERLHVPADGAPARGRRRRTYASDRADGACARGRSRARDRGRLRRAPRDADQPRAARERPSCGSPRSGLRSRSSGSASRGTCCRSSSTRSRERHRGRASPRA